MRRALLAIVLSACGAPEGAQVDVEAHLVPEGTTDIRVTFEVGTQSAVREIAFEGDDPFVFRVLVPLEGNATAFVEALRYFREGNFEVRGSFEDAAILAQGPPAFVQGDFE